MGKGWKFVLPELDKSTYQALQDMRTVHAANQWEIVSAALLAFADASVEFRATYLKRVRVAPSEQPPVSLQS